MILDQCTRGSKGLTMELGPPTKQDDNAWEKMVRRQKKRAKAAEKDCQTPPKNEVHQ